MEKLLNRNYGAIHGAYWMYYGVVCSFSSVFLLAKGYSNSEIGIILAAGNIFAVLVQPFVADLADRSKRFSVFSIMELITVLLIVLTAFLLVIEKKSFMLMFVYIMAFAWMNIVQPFCNALSFRLQEAGVHVNFGACRSVGSLTYAVMCLFLGSLVEAKGVFVLPVTGEIVLVLFMISIVVLARSFERAKKSRAGEETAQGEVLQEKKEEGEINLSLFARRHKMFLVMSCGVLGLYFANSILNTYMAQIAAEVGGDSGDVGRIFSLLAFMEIPTLVLFDRLHKRFSCKSMMKFSAIAFVIWIGICTVSVNVWMLLAAQLIQPFSFALFLPSIVHFIDENMSKGEAVKGQMVFTATTTVAAIFASVIGGAILDISGARVLTLTGTIVTAVGALIIFLSVDKAGKDIER